MTLQKTWDQHRNNDPSYGMKVRKEFTEDDYTKINLYISRLTPEQRVPLLRNIVFFLMGVQFGMRGRKEHRQLRISDISFHRYPLTAGAGLAGQECVENSGGMLSKHHQLTMGECICVLFVSMCCNTLI